MPDKEVFRVEWTIPSLEDILSIRRYLYLKFSEQEVFQLSGLLPNFETTAERFPKLYPDFSKQKKLRRAVLNKNLSVYYSIGSRKLTVISLLGYRMDYSELLLIITRKEKA